MHLRQLRYFISIVELGSFTRAAEALGVAQPALSAQIRNLEDELQVQLLLRHSRGVAPTPDGALLLARARTILGEIDETRALLMSGRETPRGRICLGITPSNDIATTSRILRRCLEDLPDVQLSVVEGISSDVVDWVGTGRADLGLVYWGDDEPANVALETLASEDLMFIERAGAPAGDTVSLAEVCEQPLILASAPHLVRDRIGEAAAKQGLTPRVPFEMQSIAMIFEMIEQGVACSVLPYGAVSRALGLGRLSARRIVEPSLSLRLALVRPTLRPMTRAAIACRALVATAFAPDGEPADGRA